MISFRLILVLLFSAALVLPVRAASSANGMDGAAVGGDGREDAKVLTLLQGPKGDPLHLPSEIRVLDDGRIVLLDGANGRLAFFEGDGRFEKYVGAPGRSPGCFMNPQGFCRGPERTLIVADTGNGRLQVLDDRGEFVRTVEWEDGGRPSRPTGVAFDADGQTLYVTDRSVQGVLVFNLPAYTLQATYFLPACESGVEAYPCSPFRAEGLLHLVEPLNGRIRRLDTAGEEAGFIGKYGLGPGRLYRPKGAIQDPEGRLFVSDSWQGTITVYSEDGAFLGLLAGEEGEPLLLDAPFGMDFDRSGRILVVEMGKHRVKRHHVRIVSMKEEREESGDPERITGDETGDPRTRTQACTLCHPEWLPRFGAGEDRTGGIDGGGGAAAERRMCLSCHDGPVAGSRASCFAPHGHADGLRMPSIPVAQVADALSPDGRVTCMTCHKAHGSVGDDYDMATTIFLRFPGPGSDFCRCCHDGPAYGANSHYTGPLKNPLPEWLVAAGAAPPGGIEGRLDCRTCHLAHGKGKEFLLVGGEDRFCTVCHESLQHRGDPHADSGVFTCRDCHASHGGAPPGRLRKRPGGAGMACANCHGEKVPPPRSGHDLARSEEACFPCHIPYGNEKTGPFLWGLGLGTGREPGEKRCRVCHGEDYGFGAKQVALPDHPGGAIPGGPGAAVGVVPCTVCHDPHAGSPALLRTGTAGSLCATCHGPEALWLFLNFHQEPRSPRR